MATNCAKNRRDERREDIFDILVDEYGFEIDEIKDFTEFEEHDKFLEGTGSMVLDRENKICYAAISIRTDEIAVMQFCEELAIVRFVLLLIKILRSVWQFTTLM